MHRSLTISNLSRALLPLAGTLAGLFNTCPANADTYPNLILSDHPISYYRLEELPGATTALDSTTNHFDGTYNFDLDTNGVSDYPELGKAGITTNSIFFKTYTDTSSVFHSGDIIIPYDPLVNPTTDGTHGAAFSAECWLQPTTQPNDYKVALADFGAYGSGIYANASGWNFYQSPGPNSYWILNMKPVVFGQATAAPINLLQWYHLAVSFDGTNATFYVNGVSQGTYNATGYLANNGTPMRIGSGPAVGFGPFDGGIDEVALYTYALSAAQISAHYQLGTNSFRAVPTPPAILTSPSTTTVYSGTTASFTTIASGTTPLSYQWYRGTTLIPGATSPTFSFICHYPADNGINFLAVVTNAYGRATSAVATLTVSTNLLVTGAPFSVSRNVGSYAAFRVGAGGALPISYQWSKGVTPIPGATNATLWLSNVQLADDNSSYSVLVSNPFTSSTLTATLNVHARAVSIPLTGYARIIAADGPVAYWRLNEVDGSGPVVDATGSFDGTYTDTSGTAVFSYLALTGIPRETDPGIGLSSGATVNIPYALELNPDTTWTAETWVKPASLGANGGDYRVVLSSQYNLYPNPYNGWYVYQQPNGTFAFVPQPGNAFITAGPNDPAHGNLLVANNWYHLVITDDGTTFTVYINGEARTSFPVAASNFIPNGINGDVSLSGGATVLGRRTDNAFNGFEGTIDDTAFYNKALTANQVKAHYLATIRLTYTQAGNNLILSWPSFAILQQADNVTGPYTDVTSAISPLTIPEGASKKFYRARFTAP